MNELFFIGNHQFINLIKAPLKLRIAAAFVFPGTVSVLFMLLGVFSGVVAFISLLGAISITFDSYSAFEDVIPVTVFCVITAIIAALLFIISYQFDLVRVARAELLDGMHREYYASTKHESFRLLMTPKVRTNLQRAPFEAKFASVRTLLSDPAIIEADNTLLAATDHYVKLSKVKLTLIEKIEKFFSKRAGLQQTGYFEQEYTKLSDQLTMQLAQHEYRANTGRELLTKITR
ncbi:MAG: hypothetical protein V4611_03385 [Patescibacteria group bacterium]